MMRVAVLDIGLGNLRSVEKALERAAADSSLACSVGVTADPDVVARADRVVFPGQGAFRDASSALATTGLGEAVRAVIARGTPYLGICLGLQALFASSEEAPGSAGLGVFAGINVRLVGGLDPASGERVKIPHMGWNRIALRSGGHPHLVAAGGEGTHFYFVHSFHAAPVDRSLIVATAKHGVNEVTAAIAKDNVLATQFHPEKSQAAGLSLLSAFLRG